MRKPFLVVYFAFVLSCLTAVSILAVTHPADAANPTLNFQARLLTPSGAVVPDGDYNVEFKIYSGASCNSSSGASCTADWAEDYYGGTTDNRLRVSDGYLTVNLGSLTAFNTSIPWGQQLWLSINIGGTTNTGTPTLDGTMFPYITMTSVPAAMALNYTDGTHTGSLAFTSTLSGSDTITLPDASGTVCLQSSTSCGFAPATGASGYIQLQGSTPGSAQTGDFNITGTGTVGSLVLQGASSYISNSHGYSNSEAFGYGAALTDINGTALGNGASAALDDVAVGSAATASGSSVAVGQGSSASQYSVAVGKGAATSSFYSVAVGRSASAGENSTAIGDTAVASSAGSIAIGANATTSAASQLVATAQYVYFGDGVSSATPDDASINTTGGSGTNVAGGTLYLDGGQGTGNANGGNLDFRVATPGASGSGQNASGVVGGFNGGNGSAFFQNSVNSSNAFQVQTSTGGDVLNVNTTNSVVDVGNVTSEQATLNVQGASSDSTSNALAVTDSSGNDLIQARDDGQVVLGRSTESGETTLGHNAIGANLDEGFNGTIIANKITTGSNAVSLTSISAYIDNIQPGGGDNYVVGLYSDSGGVPGSLLASSTQGTLTSFSWNQLSISYTLAPSTSYWLAFSTNTTGAGYHYVPYDTPTVSGLRTYMSYGNAGVDMPSTFTSSGLSNNYVDSIYATGTTVSGALSTALTISPTSGVEIQTPNNTTTAFQVQNASNASLLTIDTSGDNIDLGAVGSMALGSTINIGTSSSSSNTQAVSIGSNGDTANTVTIDSGTGTGGLQIGNSNTDHNIQIGTGTGNESVALGSTTGSSSATVQGGTGGVTIQTGATSSGNSGGITIQSGNASSGTSGNVFIDTGASTAASGSNLEHDTFESGTGGYAGGYGYGSEAQSGTYAEAGSHSLTFTTTADAWGIYGPYPGGAVTPGSLYHVNLWIRGTSAGTVSLSASWNGGTGDGYTTIDQITNATSGWTELSGDVTAPAGVTNMELLLSGDTTTGDVVYLDEGSIDGGTATPVVSIGSVNAAAVVIGNTAAVGGTLIQGGADGIELSTTSGADINVGSNSNSVITIGNATSTEPLTLQGNGITQTMTGDSGSGPSDIIKTSTNSSTAFQVQDSSSNELFGVDTSGDNINIGANGTTAVSSTVSIATSTGASQTVHVADGSTETSTVTIGSGSSTSTTILQAGSGGLNLVTGAASGNTGGVVIQSGSSSGGVSGNIAIDTGASSVVSGSNLESDGFESGSVDNWHNWFGTDSAVSSSAEHHSGSDSLAVTTSADNGGWALQGDNGYPGISIESGLAYTLSVWVKGTVSESVDLSVTWNGGGGGFNVIDAETMTTTGWTELTGTITAPAGVTNLVPIVHGDDAGSTVYVDDFSLSGSSAPFISIGGTNAAAVQLGNHSEAGATTIQSGGGGINLDSVSGNVTIGSGNVGEANGQLLVLDSDTDATFSDGTASNVPSEVDGAMFFSSTNQDFMCGVSGSWETCNGLLYSNTSAGSNVASCTTSCGSLAQAAIPANYCQAGRVINIKASGVYTTSSTTVQFGLYYGSSSTSSSDTLLGGSSGTLTQQSSSVTASSWTWQLYYTVTCFSSTSMMLQGYEVLQEAAAAAGTSTQIYALPISSTTTVSTSSDNSIYIFPVFGANAAGNNATMEQYVVTAN